MPDALAALDRSLSGDAWRKCRSCGRMALALTEKMGENLFVVRCVACGWTWWAVVTSAWP